MTFDKMTNKEKSLGTINTGDNWHFVREKEAGTMNFHGM
jgi:hypothetical protein